MVIDSFITWDFLGQFMGVVIATMLIVQFIKEIPGIKRISTKYLTALVAFATLLSYQIANGSFTWRGLYLVFLNAIFVTMTATGGYDFAQRKKVITPTSSQKDETPKEYDTAATEPIKAIK